MADIDPVRVAGRRKPPVRHTASLYRVRSADSTPPGVHLANPTGGRPSAHGRPRGAASSALRYVLTTLVVFVTALLLVTGVEVVTGQPLSGGAAGHTSLGDVLHPTSP